MYVKETSKKKERKKERKNVCTVCTVCLFQFIISIREKGIDARLFLLVWFLLGARSGGMQGPKAWHSDWSMGKFTWEGELHACAERCARLKDPPPPKQAP